MGGLKLNKFPKGLFIGFGHNNKLLFKVERKANWFNPGYINLFIGKLNSFIKPLFGIGLIFIGEFFEFIKFSILGTFSGLFVFSIILIIV